MVEVFYAINEYKAEAEEERPPVIVAPGEQRLPFFFPQMQIINQPITELGEFEALNATHFLYGTQAMWEYQRAGYDIDETQMVSGLGRVDRFQEVAYHSDATFSYELYHFITKRNRFKPHKERFYPVNYYDIDIAFGDKLLFRAEGISPSQFFENQNIHLTAAWKVLQSIPVDYLFVYELFNRDISQVGYQWVVHANPFRHGYYSTTLWDPGETVRDQQYVRISSTSKIPNGDNYEMRVRVLDTSNNQYLPVTVDGHASGYFFTLSGQFKVGA